MSNEFSPALNDKNQGSTTEIIKNKLNLPGALPGNSLTKSPFIKSDVIQVETTEKTPTVGLNPDKKSKEKHSMIKQKNLQYHRFFNY